MTTKTPAVLLSLDRVQFLRLLGAEPGVRETLERLARERRETLQLLVDEDGEKRIALRSVDEGEVDLPETFVEYEGDPREYALNAIQTVLTINTRTADLYSDPYDQLGEQLVPSLRHNLGTHLPLGEQRITGHHPPGERHLGRHLAGRAPFMPLARGSQLGDYGGRLVDGDAHQIPTRRRAPVHPRTALPSTATASVSVGTTPVCCSQCPTACSNAATASALKMRWNVATQGIRPVGKPTAVSRSGASSTRSRTHGAMALRLVLPHSIAATATCESATRGIGGYCPRQPYGRRGSGIRDKAAAHEPGGAGGTVGSARRMDCSSGHHPAGPLRSSTPPAASDEMALTVRGLSLLLRMRDDALRDILDRRLAVRARRDLGEEDWL